MFSGASLVMDKKRSVESNPDTKQKKAKSFLEYSNGISKSYNMKTVDAIRITSTNFREVILGLAHRILTANDTGKELLMAVAKFLKNESPELDQEVHAMLIDIDYKKDTFDLLTPLRKIEAEITKSLLRKTNAVGKLVFQVWYNYLDTKYGVKEYTHFRRNFGTDVNVLKEFLATVIYHVYGEWVFLIEKKKDIYPYIYKEFTPSVLSSHPGFARIYVHALRHLGETQLKMDRDKRPSFFKIKSCFNCEDSERPFFRTIEVLGEFYREYHVKKKLLKLKELAITLKQEIRKCQQARIERKEQKEIVQIDTDNITACLNYCILRSGCNGVAEACSFLELFYLDDKKFDSSEYLYNLPTGHFMTTLFSAAMYLQQLDKEQ